MIIKQQAMNISLENTQESSDDFVKPEDQRPTQQPIDKPPTQIIQSQFLNSYRQFMDVEQNYDHSQSHEKETRLRFRKHHIIYDPLKYQDNSVTFKSRRQINTDLIQAKVILGPFVVKLSLLNVKEKCSIKLMKMKGKGIFGEIYVCSIFDSTTVIKALRFPEKGSSIETIVNATKQYAINKIAHCIDCGPVIKNELGFDLLVYEDAVIFSMGEIVPINECNNVKQINWNLLKEKLKRLHSYHIIHFDLKPENIGVCCQRNEPIFIDFGISEVIKQEIGQKSFMKFRGNLNFCSKQMQNLYTAKNTQSGFTDVYYNDCESLKKIFEQIAKENNKNDLLSFERSLFTNYNIENIFFIELFKYEIYIGNRFYMIKNMLEINENRLSGRHTTFALQCLLQCRIYKQQKKYFLSLESFKKQIYFERLQKKMTFYNFRAQDIEQIKILEQFSSEEEECKYLLKLNQEHWKYIIDKYKLNIKINLHLNQGINVEEIDKTVSILHFQPFLSKYIDSTPELIRGYFSYFLSKISFTSLFNRTTLKEKYSLAHVFIKEVLCSQPSNDEIQNIKDSLGYLVQYCLKQPVDEWKIDNITDIISQCFILDKIYLPLKQISSFILSKITTIQSKIRCFYELSFISTFLSQKTYSSNINLLKKSRKRIVRLRNQLFSRLVNNYNQDEKKQSQAIKNISSMLKTYHSTLIYSNRQKLLNLEEIIVFSKKELKVINNREVRVLFQNIVKREILVISNGLQNFGLSQKILCSMYGENLSVVAKQTYSLSNKFIFLFNYMLLRKNKEVTEQMCASLKQLFGETNLYSQFDFDTQSFLLFESKFNLSVQNDQYKLKQVMKNLPNLFFVTSFSFNTIANLATRLESSQKSFIDDNQEFIYNFMDCFKKMCSKWSKIEKIEQICFQLLIIGHLVKIVKSQQKIYQFLTQIIDQVQYRVQNQSCQFISAYKEMYWIPYLILKKQQQKCNQIVQNLSIIIKSNAERYEVLQLYIQNVKFSFIMLNFRISQKETEASIDYMKVCIKNRNFYYIFEEQKIEYLIVICQNLINDGKNYLMYQCLLHSAQYLSEYPQNKYVNRWISQLSYLGRKYHYLYQLPTLDEQFELKNSIQKKEYLLFLPLISLNGSEKEDQKVLKLVSKRNHSNLSFLGRNVFTFFIYFRVCCNDLVPKRYKKYIVRKKMKHLLTTQQQYITAFKKDFKKIFSLRKAKMNQYLGLIDLKMKKIYSMIYQ